jgi:predicted transposase
MKLTAPVRLLPSDEQRELLKATLERVNAACNAISDYAWANQVFNQLALHKALYAGLRKQFDLTAQMVVRCLGKVADSYKADKKARRTFKEHGAIPYDSRILNYRQQTETVSIWTVAGRQAIPYQCGERQRELLKHQQGESDLWYTGGAFYLLATCEIEEPTPAQVAQFLGVDERLTSIKAKGRQGA